MPSTTWRACGMCPSTHSSFSRTSISTTSGPSACRSATEISSTTTGADPNGPIRARGRSSGRLTLRSARASTVTVVCGSSAITRCSARSPATNRSRTVPRARERPERTHRLHPVGGCHPDPAVRVTRGGLDERPERVAADVGRGRTARSAPRRPRRVRRGGRGAVSTPPTGPSPGYRSATTGSARAARVRRRRHRRARTGSAPTARERVEHAVAHRPTVDVDQRLGPPHPPTRAAGQDDTGEPHVAGMPDGSSCSRNCSQRSASSVSPISAAISPRPRSDRRNP